MGETIEEMFVLEHGVGDKKSNILVVPISDEKVYQSVKHQHNAHLGYGSHVEGEPNSSREIQVEKTIFKKEKVYWKFRGDHLTDLSP